MSEFNQARREGSVKFGYDFNTVAEVTHLWGLSATKLPYHVSFKIPGRENAICLLLSEKGGGGWQNIPHYGTKTDGRGWHEIVQIDEFNSDPEESAKRVADELAMPLERYVFWHESRDGASWYKFYGVFRLDTDATLASRDVGENACIYRRVSDEGKCPRCEVSTRTVSEDEFRSLPGKILTANLLDTVSYEVAGEKRHTGEIKVWPGRKFLVVGVSPSTGGLVCRTADETVLSAISAKGEVAFTIPARDLELGYFTVLGNGTLEKTKSLPLEGSDHIWGCAIHCEWAAADR